MKYVKLVKFLDSLGSPPKFFQALQNHSPPLSQVLAHVCERDIQGFTALHMAVDSNETDIATLLIAKGANVNAKFECHLTPLHCSFQNNNLL